ncbi:DMT family transporter [Corticicoccus populi]|uniref:DMT family transporter n=1 Tax=Corticicoccus populi TaxID=1812821 RepID=A0ABW5WUK1_9STAP
MAWIILIFAGIFEMLAVNAINVFTHKRTKTSLAGIVLFFAISFVCLSVAMREIDMSTAYAIWTGIGAAGGALLGMIFYKEPKNIGRIFFIAMIIACAVGLKILG